MPFRKLKKVRKPDLGRDERLLTRLIAAVEGLPLREMPTATRVARGVLSPRTRVSVYGCEGVARILKVPFDYALGLRHGLERETWLPRTNDEDYNRGLSVGCSLRDYLGDYS